METAVLTREGRSHAAEGSIISCLDLMQNDYADRDQLPFLFRGFSV